MLSINLTEWADRWSIASISVLTVFIILFILVGVLWLFGWLSNRSEQTVNPFPLGQCKGGGHPIAEADADDQAAVAMAIYLYHRSANETPRGVLTIRHEPSHWHAELNPRL